MSDVVPYPRDIAPTGISGLDDVLMGGFTRNRLFLVEGVPGSGKTTLALQFLATGARSGETVLYVTLSETEEELRSVAASHGWSLNGITIQELSPSEAELEPDEQNTMFHPSEVELAATTKRVLTDVDRLKPTRVVFDSLSELRLLAGSPLRYRRQILALKQYFANRQCTVLLLDDLTATDRDLQVQSIAHGVVQLEQLQPEYGSQRRRLRVIKYRGVHFRGGYHDYAIRLGGLQVFPRLVAAEHRQVATRARRGSAITELDTLLGGGIEEGTSTLVVGAAGTGKSTLAAQFAAAAASRGERAVPFRRKPADASLAVHPAQDGPGGRHCQRARPDPANRPCGTDAPRVHPQHSYPGRRRREDRRDRQPEWLSQCHAGGALPDDPAPRALMYLGQQGVATILIGAHQGFIGAQIHTPVDASYLADAIMLLRYFESRGEVRQAISAVKKRGGEHERTIREFHVGRDGIRVGETLREFRGVLTGVPIYEGTESKSS